MIGILPYNPSKTDFAGKIYLNPNYFQSQSRIKSLIDCSLCFEKLNNCQQDLPIQFENPLTFLITFLSLRLACGNASANARTQGSPRGTRYHLCPLSIA